LILVLAVLGALGSISALIQTSPALSKVLVMVQGVIDLASFVQLIQKVSARYFKQN
jgi:hypothetical protein